MLHRLLGIARGKDYRWKQRYDEANEHNGRIPRDFRLDDSERKAIVDYHDARPLEGYRRLMFMMLDENVVCVSPSTTYRVLSGAGRHGRWRRRPSSKGSGFAQPVWPQAAPQNDQAYARATPRVECPPP